MHGLDISLIPHNSQLTAFFPSLQLPEAMNIRSIINSLILQDDGLLKECLVSHFQASGPGGQKRNRVYSAVRLKHRPSGLDVTASEHRQSSANLRSALARLRLQMALSLKPGTGFSTPGDSHDTALELPESWPQFRVPVKTGHRDLPNMVFLSLYLLNQYSGEVSSVARKLQVSTSSLVKFLKSDKQVWKKAREIREFFGKPLLK
jgi:hypothetical protein